MKTVCKKLLCLMLVAMMLVSAVPFAFAADGDALSVPVYVHEDGVDMGCAGQLTVDATVALTQSLAETMVRMTDRKFLGWENKSGEDVTNGELKPGEWLENALNEGYYLIVNVASTVCKHTETTTTYTNTCGEDGYAIVKCKACGEELDRDPVAATGKHNFVGGSCTDCDATRNAIDSITFYFLDKDGDETSEVVYVYEDGAHITPPSAPVNPVSGFSYWAEYANGTGERIDKDETLVYNSQTPNAFHAIYNKKSAMSELKIYAVRYVNGVRKEAHYLFSDYFTTSNDNDMYKYLWDNDDAIFTAAVKEIGEGYTWNEKFYNYFTDEEITDANLKDNGDKSVYIKMNTKNSNEAQVLLYVHKAKSSTVNDILEMDGYNAGEWVYLKDVKNFLDDEGYSWSSTSSLYTDEEWEDLMDGESPSGSNGIKITDNGTYKIHIILKGASQSSNADSTNPKTGDYITVAATTMVLAAAALVSVLELKKRKMI